MKKRIEHIIILFTTVFSIFSCKKFVEVDKPVDKITSDVVFADSSTAESAVIGLYVKQVGLYIGGSFLNFNMTVQPALSADEITDNFNNESNGEFATNSITSNNYDNLGSWTNAYNVIFHANSIIEHLNASGQLNKSQKSRLIAEAKFIRALNYFYLVNVYGKVPLAVTTDYAVNSLLVRSEVTEVYEQILEDLTEAQRDLPENYNLLGYARATKWAATALLARLYLYQQEWSKAIAESSKIIERPNFALTSLSDAFLANNAEGIFQLIPAMNLSYCTMIAYEFIRNDPQSLPVHSIRNELMNSFEANDQRKSQWIGYVTIDGVEHAYPYKYKVYNVPPGSDKPEYNIVFRLAEQYLIRAEALAHLDRLDNAAADLDKVRNRAGLPSITEILSLLTKDNLLTAINQENRVEFFCEWGHRWFDLKRLETADAVLGPLKGTNWQPSDVLYPIPMNELLTNPNLDQNLGY